MATYCSAPGKVLLAGGYLILDRPHSGTVLALDARFFSGVELLAFVDDLGIADRINDSVQATPPLVQAQARRERSGGRSGGGMELERIMVRAGARMWQRVKNESVIFSSPPPE